MRVDEIRKLPQGRVLLMYREIEAVVNVVPWWERPDSEKFRNSRAWCLKQEGITAENAAQAADNETAAEAKLATAS